MKIQILDRGKKKKFLVELGMGSERFIIGDYVIKLYGSPSFVSAILGTFFI